MKTFILTLSCLLIAGLGFSQNTNTKTNSSDTTKTTGATSTRTVTTQQKKLVKVNGSQVNLRTNAIVRDENLQKNNSTGTKEEEDKTPE